MTDKPANETPRTDKAKFKILSSLQSGTDEVVHAWVAEELERALQAAEQAFNDTAKQALALADRVDAAEERAQDAERQRDEQIADKHRICDEYAATVKGLQDKLIVAEERAQRLEGELERQRRYIGCVWCGANVYEYTGPLKVSDADAKLILKAAQEHDETCHKNPLASKLSQERAARERAEALFQRATGYSINEYIEMVKEIKHG